VRKKKNAADEFASWTLSPFRNTSEKWRPSETCSQTFSASPANFRPKPENGSIFGVSEDSNEAPTSFRYVRDRVLEAVWDFPSSANLDESAEVCFIACS